MVHCARTQLATTLAQADTGSMQRPITRCPGDLLSTCGHAQEPGVQECSDHHFPTDRTHSVAITMGRWPQ
eukprot:513345-Alexandrium_andersonii.AAC.1